METHFSSSPWFFSTLIWALALAHLSTSLLEINSTSFPTHDSPDTAVTLPRCLMSSSQLRPPRPLLDLQNTYLPFYQHPPLHLLLHSLLPFLPPPPLLLLFILIAIIPVVGPHATPLSLPPVLVLLLLPPLQASRVLFLAQPSGIDFFFIHPKAHYSFPVVPFGSLSSFHTWSLSMSHCQAYPWTSDCLHVLGPHKTTLANPVILLLPFLIFSFGKH